MISHDYKPYLIIILDIKTSRISYLTLLLCISTLTFGIPHCINYPFPKMQWEETEEKHAEIPKQTPHIGYLIQRECWRGQEGLLNHLTRTFKVRKENPDFETGHTDWKHQKGCLRRTGNHPPSKSCCNFPHFFAALPQMHCLYRQLQSTVPLLPSHYFENKTAPHLLSHTVLSFLYQVTTSNSTV